MAVTGVVLTFNEGRNIRACLESLSWADAILVVDSGSTDETVRIAEELADQVLTSNLLGPENPGGFGRQRNFALEKVETPWVFFLDADERCTPELAVEIQKAVLDSEPGVDGFQIQRKEHFFGIYSPHTHGDSPLLRLARTKHARWDERLVHEGLHVDGRVENLREFILHYSKSSLADYVATQNRYTSLEAEEAARAGVRPARTPLSAMLKTFCNLYLYKGAYREGGFGLLMSLLMTYYSFLIWAKQWEIEVREKRWHPNAAAPWWLVIPAKLLSGTWRLLRPPRETKP